MMKLIFAIVSADAVEPVSKALVDQHFSVTHVSSVSGFLRRGNTTLVVGVDSEQLESALSIMRATCAPFSKPDSHALNLFVVDASQYVQI